MWRGRNLAAAEGDVVVELELLRERLVELEARAVEDIRRQDALRLLLQLLQPRRAAPVLPLALPRKKRCALSAEGGGSEGGRELLTSGQLRTNTDSRNPVIGLSELRARTTLRLSEASTYGGRVITGHPFSSSQARETRDGLTQRVWETPHARLDGESRRAR